MSSRFNPWRDLRGLPRESWILALASLINRAGTMVLPLMMLHLTKNLGFTTARAGLALSVYGLTALVCAPVTGHLSDRWGAARVMTWSLASSGLIMWLIPLARTWPQVLVILVLLAVTSEAFRPANLALVGDLAGPELRRQGFALNRLAVNLGMSIGPALGGVLATFSFNSIFWVDGATSLAAALVLAREPLRASRSEKEAVHSGHLAQGPLPIFTDRRLRYFLVALLPAMLVFFQHNSTMAVYVVNELGFSTAIYGMLFTINTLIIVLLEVRINGATAHWSHGRTLALAGLLIGLGFGSLALAKSLTALVVTVVIWTFGEMILLPVASAYVTEIAPPARRGEYMGYYTMCFGLAFTLGPGIGTAIMDRYGSTTLWLSTLAVGLVCAIMLGRVPAATALPQPDPGTRVDLSAK